MVKKKKGLETILSRFPSATFGTIKASKGIAMIMDSNTLTEKKNP